MPADPRRFGRLHGSPKFPQTASDRADRDPGRPRHGRDPAIACRPRFGGRQQAALTFVQMRSQRDETIADRSEIDHGPGIRAMPIPWNRPFPRRLNRVAYFRASPKVAQGLEQSLIEALVGCIAETNTHEHHLSQRHHELILRRFHRIVEESPDTPLYIPEICAAIGVSARTLLMCCQEHLGMGPKQFLQRRRLHLARQALRTATPGTATVTEIFSRYGFWQFGRTAGMYKSAFDETPTETLRSINY